MGLQYLYWMWSNILGYSWEVIGVKLIIAIIQDDFANRVTKNLMDKKYRVTKLSSTGGFLKSGNTTLLIGVEDEKTDEIIKLVEEECKKEDSSRKQDGTSDACANIFVLNMDEFKRI